jgi:ribosomal protein L29
LIPTEELSEELSETPTEKLVQEFNNLRDQLTNSVESTQLNQTILMQVKGVWQSLVDSNSSELGDNTVKELRKNMAQILFIAQYVCELFLLNYRMQTIFCAFQGNASVSLRMKRFSTGSAFLLAVLNTAHQIIWN